MIVCERPAPRPACRARDPLAWASGLKSGQEAGDGLRVGSTHAGGAPGSALELSAE